MSRLLVLLLLAACGGWSPSPGPPPRATRVVSLLPSLTAIVRELGAADRLVACTEHCDPGDGRDLPRVPWEGGRAAEVILRLAPDLVLKQAPRKAEDPLREALRAAGVAVVAVPSETMADVREAIVAVGDALGLPERAARFRERFDADLERARLGARGRPVPSVLFVFHRDPGKVANVMGAGPGTFLDELIRFAGGRNVLAGYRAPYPQVRLEDLVRLKPEVIVDNLPAGEDPAAAWAEFAEAGVPAVVEGRVRVVQDNALLIPGPHLPRSVARMVELIHGR